MKVSGIIKKKNVKAGTYGDKVSFLVGGNWLSAFATDKKLSQDAKDLLRNLQEGDEGDFEIAENLGKDGKTYMNIVGLEKVTRLGGDTGEPQDYSVGPTAQSNRTDKTDKVEAGDTRTRSMCVAYAKDLVVADKVEIANLKAVAEELYHYVMTGE